MALSAKTGSFNVTTAAAGNTVAVSGLGFTPLAVLFVWNGRTGSTDGVARANLERGFGVAIAPTSRFAVSSGSVDTPTSSVTYAANHDAACIISQANAAGDDGAAADGDINGAMDLQSLDVDGFTLVIDDAFPRDFRVHYLALGGDSLLGLATGVFTPTGTAPVTQAVSGLGFTPSCVLFAGVAAAAGAPPADVADSSMFIGAMTGASGEGVWAGCSDDGSGTMQTVSYAKRGECIARVNAAGTSMDIRGEFSSFDADGFTVNWLERGAGGRVFYLAMEGVSATIGDLLTQTDTTTAITESGLGFTPAALMFLSHGKTESVADTPQDHDLFSCGFATSASARNAVASLDEDNTGLAEVTTASEFDAVYINLDTTSAVAGLMDIQSFDADGFTAIMDDADPSQAFVWYLALGPADGGGGGFSPTNFPHPVYPNLIHQSTDVVGY